MQIDDIAEKLDKLALPSNVDYVRYFEDNQRDVAKLKRLIDFTEELERSLDPAQKERGAKLPWAKTHGRFAFHRGDVTLWSGFNGHFKSMVTGFVALDLIRQGERVCMASFEMRAVNTINRLARQHSASKTAGIDEFARLVSDCGADLLIFDHLGQIAPQRLYGVIQYAVNELGVTHFFIDSLMRVVAGEDKYNEQKDFVVNLCRIAIETNCHIHLIHHTRKGDETNVPTRYEAKGSGAIADNVANSLVVWANKQNVLDKPPMQIKCDKQRNGDWEGSIGLKFNADSLTFSEC